MRRKISKNLADWHELWEHAVDMAILVREDVSRATLNDLILTLSSVADTSRPAAVTAGPTSYEVG